MNIISSLAVLALLVGSSPAVAESADRTVADRQGLHKRGSHTKSYLKRAAIASSANLIHYSQMGPDIDGSKKDESTGKAVAISKDGLRVAVSAPEKGRGNRGATTILDWDASLQEWVQVGQNIVGLDSDETLGYSIAMNEDGSRIVLGAPQANDDKGLIRTYELDSTTGDWRLLGNMIHPEKVDGQAGFAVATNAAGDIISFGAPRTDWLSGSVSVFQFVGGQWVALGQDIDTSEFPNDDYWSYYYPCIFSGGSIAMDASGLRLAVGVRLGSGTRGHVGVYDYDGSMWVLNAKIKGVDYYDRFGGDVDISEDGTRIIVGAFTGDGGGPNLGDAGEVSVFDFDGSDWNMVGQPIYGEGEGDKMGETVAISGDGEYLID